MNADGLSALDRVLLLPGGCFYLRSYVFCPLQMDRGIGLFQTLPFLTLVSRMLCRLILRCVRDPAREAGCRLLPLFWADLVQRTCLSDAPRLAFIVFLLKREHFFFSLFRCVQSFAFPPEVLSAPRVT